jgi:hypothetical protein
VSNFKSTAPTDRLLELISNQLQFASWQTTLDTNPSDPLRDQFLKNFEKLKFRIINQRTELGIDIGGA